MRFSFLEGLLYAGAVLMALCMLAGDGSSGRGASKNETMSKWVMPEVKTKLERYPALLVEWSRNGLSEHFPKVIPAGATDVRLSAYPVVLQGGGWLQVRFVLPAAQVKAIYDDATARAKAFYDGGDKFALEDGKGGGGPAGTSFKTSGDPEEKSFPEDYRVFVFYARDGMPEGGFRWNHGDSKGVVVSLQRNEVIYFLESW